MSAVTPTVEQANPASRATIIPSEQGGLTPAQIASFEENGYLHVKGVVSREELQTLSAAESKMSAIAAADQITNSDYFYTRNPHDGKMVLYRIGYTQAKSEEFLKLLGHPRILRIAEAIQGRNMICGGGFSMVTKTPGYGAAIPWHIDPAHCKVRHGINIGIYLDDADAENGMLWVVPGSHKRTGFDLQEQIEQHGFRIPGAIPVPTQAGDLVIHNENVLHGSPVTHSQRRRRVIYSGVRTVEEQLARGLNFPWARGVFRVLQRAIQLRAAAEVGRGETPFEHNPTFAECRVAVNPDDFIELRITDGDRR